MKRLAMLSRIVKRHGRGEHGTSTVEWAGLTAVVTILLLAVIGYVDAVNGGPVSGAISDLMGRTVLSFEAGGQAGGSLPGAGVAAPSVDPPSVTVPRADVPAVVAPSLGITTWIDQPAGSDDGGGGFWGWVGDQWQSFSNWVGEQWQNLQGWWEGLPNWLQGLLIGLAAAVALVATVLIAVGIIVALGISLPVSAAVIAVALAIGAVVAIAAGLIYGLTHPGDSFNALHAFLWSYGLGLVAFAVSVVAAATGAATAAWAWLSQIAWPALAHAGRWLAGRLPLAWNWVRTVAWPALVQGARWLAARPGVILNWVRTTAWPALVSGLHSLATAVWTRFAALFPRLAQILASGVSKLGWSAILRWAGFSAAMQFFVYWAEVFLGWREFSPVSLVTTLLTAALMGGIFKILAAGFILANSARLISTVGAKIGGWLVNVMTQARIGIATIFSQLGIKSAISYIKRKIGEWWDRLTGGSGDPVGEPTPIAPPTPTPAPHTPTPPPTPAPMPAPAPPPTPSQTPSPSSG